MQQLNYSEVRQNLARVLDDAQNSPITITKYGKPTAVILNIDDFSEFEQYKQQKLKQEFDSLMLRHGEQIKALADK